jgi:hypothetical protein
MDTVTDHSTAEVLSKTLDALRTRGWAQYADEADTGEMCLRGALNFALAGTTSTVPLTPDDWALYRSAERALWNVGAGDPSIIIWNDQRGLTFEDVERALVAAIEWAGGALGAGEQP